MKTTRMLLALSIFIMAIGLSQSAAAESGTDPNFTVELPNIDDPNAVETITIPNGRPIYALLVSGFHQNRNLDMFHFYNFAKCLQEKGAYVHYAWWNNLLAPYMEKPLHNVNSVPSTGPLPIGDMLNVLPFPSLLNKAVPNDDYQFQADANSLLTAIRQHNPDAAIVMVGHSMGGDAIVRLADSMPADFDIDLLAPIDPVGNRSCIPNYSWGGGNFCNGLFNFTRWRATHVDWMTNIIFLYDPPKRAFGNNIKYLYHRWQQEFAPPFDYSCPNGEQSGSIPWPCASGKQESEYLYDHPEALETSIYADSNNIQSIFATSLYSGYDAYPRPGWPENSGGGLDGHGEIVGFRGVIPGTSDSYPMALNAQGNWPSRYKENDLNDENDPNRVRRVQILMAWEADPDYLRDNGFAPKAPDLCMVSDDMCTILNTKLGLQMNSAPVADAGADQTVSVGADCSVAVTLDGSDSNDADGDELTYTWFMDGQEIATGVNPIVELTLGEHAIELIVDDGFEDSEPDEVVITVEDTTPAAFSLSVEPAVLWPPNKKMILVTPSWEVSDNCDESPGVSLVDITMSAKGDVNNYVQIGGDGSIYLRAKKGRGRAVRIYTLKYEAVDDSGNAAIDSATVVVPHDRR